MASAASPLLSLAGWSAGPHTAESFRFGLNVSAWALVVVARASYSSFAPAEEERSTAPHERTSAALCLAHVENDSRESAL